MSRSVVNYPVNPDSWNELPKDFLDYLEFLDEERIKLTKNNSTDLLYPTYDYEWDLDSEIPMTTILLYWNRLDEKLPSPKVILKEINDCIAEQSYDYYIGSFYSY